MHFLHFKNLHLHFVNHIIFKQSFNLKQQLVEAKLIQAISCRISEIFMSLSQNINNSFLLIQEKFEGMHTESDSKTITRFYYANGIKSLDLDIGSCGTLYALGNLFMDNLLPEEKCDKAKKKLYYFNCTEKEQIKQQNDYKIYLQRRRKLDHLDLYVVEERVFFNSFIENAKWLIQNYSDYDQQYDGKKSLGNEGQNIFSMGFNKNKQSPQQSWLEADWLKWGETNIRQDKYNLFRFQIQKMFSKRKTLTVTQKKYQMDNQLLNFLDRYGTKRCVSAESKQNLLISSIYNKVAGQFNKEKGEADKFLLNVAAWKDQKTQIKENNIINNFENIQETNAIIPIMNQPLQMNKMGQKSEKKKYSLFSRQQLTPEQRKQKYIAIDQFYNIIVKVYHGKLNYETAKQKLKDGSLRIFSDEEKIIFFQEVIRAKKDNLGQEIHKVPTSPQDGVLLPFDDSEKVGILGDWGSGLPDSFDLLDELALNRGATIILHLGDVYYSGCTEEFKKISDKIKQLRTKVPRLRYYTIPGNHDFYTNGGPFYASLDDYNDKQEYKQHFGFFCLRNKSNTVQYIGLDTGYSDSGTFNEIDPKYQGPFVYPEELAWAKEKILSFKGQTILLTHHQAFSPYEPILGRYTKFGVNNPQINPKLCEQFFEFLPKVSVWYWGHEHRFSVFKPNSYGIPCTRTLGNSAFQVHQPNTYEVKYPDYNPVINRYNPGRKDNQDPLQPYFDHTGAVVKFANPKIQVCYIDMTSSYMQKSDVVRTFNEQITCPVIKKVETNRLYRIKDACGLSFSFNKNSIFESSQIRLNYKPDDLIFQKADDPKYNGPITSVMELYIKFAFNYQYLYLKPNLYVSTKKNPTESSKFKFVKKNGTIDISTGDSLDLINVYSGMELHIGRYYYYGINLNSYYCLATGGKTVYTQVQIYDPTDSNTDLLE